MQRNKVEYLLNSMAFAVGCSATRASYGQSSIMNVEYRECPHCKNEHAATALYCENTGKRLKNACTNKACSEYGKYVLPAKAKFCLLCGTPIVDAQEQERMQHSAEIEQLKQRHAMQLQQRQDECNSCKTKFEKREQNFLAEIQKLKELIEKEEQAQRKQDTFTANGVTFKMIAVQGGTYTMGATSEQGSDAWDTEKPAHKETVSDFMIGETPVTQELWQAVMGSNPSRFIGDLQRPVEMVSWDDCQEFIKKLNQLTGQNFRLPTEAEWEYAARGGNRSRGYKYSGSNDVDAVAWYGVCIGGTTHPVKTKQPNELGIYDMSGNVWEWCQDKWCGIYNSPRDSGDCVLRGGSWINNARYVRVSFRNYYGPGNRSSSFGLRLAL